MRIGQSQVTDGEDWWWWAGRMLTGPLMDRIADGGRRVSDGWRNEMDEVASTSLEDRMDRAEGKQTRDCPKRLYT